MEPRPILVLIVDDYAEVRKIFARGLSRAGMQTCEAADVEEALAVASRTRPDVVLLDLFLWGKSGLEVARALRTDPAGAPVIAMSGHGNEEVRARASEAGCDEFVRKPCSPTDLVTAIEVVLARRASQLLAAH